MSQKNILIIIIIIAIVAVGAYFVFTSSSPSVSLEEGKILEEETPEGEQQGFEEISPEGEPGAQELLESLEYKIINQGQITETAEGAVSEKKMVYDVVAGKISEETVKALAERIITEVTQEDEEIDSITLNFYENEGSVEGMKIDVAVVSWIPNKISVKMVED